MGGNGWESEIRVREVRGWDSYMRGGREGRGEEEEEK